MKRARSIKPAQGAFGRLIRKHRLEKDLRLCDVGAELAKWNIRSRGGKEGLSHAFLSACESGENIPDAKMLPALAAVLDILLGDLAVAFLTTSIVLETKRRFKQVQDYLPPGFGIPPDFEKEVKAAEEELKQKTAAEH